ncbi:MAG: cardiolipin synthase [Planctomycetes bacterium]|nr:cardiolipin synthase [Planctomycetota bacterium]
MTVWEVILAVLLLLGVQAALGIVMERRSPVATWAWLLILTLIPVVGVPLYLLFGRTTIKRKIRLGASAARQLGREGLPLEFPPSMVGAAIDLDRIEVGTARLAVGLGGTLLRACNRVDVLQDGPETFAALVQAIREATHYVHLEFFIFSPGGIGARLRDALAEAAGRGVEVRMLFDAFGSFRLPAAYLAPVLERGGRLEFFAPVRFSRLRRRPDFRNHRKILVVDGRVGFVGGINVMDEYVADVRPDTPWRDTHLRVVGPIVQDLERVLNESWFLATDEVLAEPRHFGAPAPAGDALAQVVASGPDNEWPAIEKIYTSAIFAARRNIHIATPYLVPTDAVLSALASAALRGVTVQVLVPCRGDHTLVQWAGRSYYPELLEAGVRVFEFGPRIMHAKVLTVDGRFNLVGTANLDIRSFRLNYEVGMIVYDRAVTAELDAALARDVAQSHEVEIEAFRKRPYLQRFRENTARLFSPVL